MRSYAPRLSRRRLLAASLAALPLQDAFAQAAARLIVPAAAGDVDLGVLAALPGRAARPTCCRACTRNGSPKNGVARWWPTTGQALAA